MESLGQSERLKSIEAAIYATAQSDKRYRRRVGREGSSLASSEFMLDTGLCEQGAEFQVGSINNAKPALLLVKWTQVGSPLGSFSFVFTVGAGGTTFELPFTETNISTASGYYATSLPCLRGMVGFKVKFTGTQVSGAGYSFNVVVSYGG